MGFFDKLVKEVTRPVKKVFKTETNRIVGDIKGEISRSAALRSGLKVGMTALGVPGPVSSLAVESLRRAEEPKGGIAWAYSTPADGTLVTGGNMESWAWTQKYLQTQRQVAEGKAKEAEKMKPLAAAAMPADEIVEKIKEIAVPAAGVGVFFWLLR